VSFHNDLWSFLALKGWIIILWSHFVQFLNAKQVFVTLCLMWWHEWLLYSEIGTKYELGSSTSHRQASIPFVQYLIIEFDLILEVLLWTMKLPQAFLFIFVDAYFWSSRLEI